MTKFCSFCGDSVLAREVRGHHVFTMYQPIDIYEEVASGKQEMRTQPIKYICDPCRVKYNGYDGWLDSSSNPHQWREING